MTLTVYRAEIHKGEHEGSVSVGSGLSTCDTLKEWWDQSLHDSAREGIPNPFLWCARPRELCPGPTVTEGRLLAYSPSGSPRHSRVAGSADSGIGLHSTPLFPILCPEHASAHESQRSNGDVGSGLGVQQEGGSGRPGVEDMGAGHSCLQPAVARLLDQCSCIFLLFVFKTKDVNV